MEKKYTIEQIKLKRAGLPQSLRLAIENIQEDYVIHLTLGSGARRPRHQVSISQMNSRYHYFDSNAGYVSGIEDPVQFMTLLKKVLLKSYGSESQQLEFEVYRVKTRDALPGEEIYQGLFGFRSERSRLANQDQALGTLHLKDTTIVSRTSLYEWGLGYLDKSSKLIAPIDAKFVMTDETLLSGLEAKMLGINKQRYEERLSRFLRKVSRLREDGSEFKNELKTALDLLPWVHGFMG